MTKIRYFLLKSTELVSLKIQSRMLWLSKEIFMKYMFLLQKNNNRDASIHKRLSWNYSSLEQGPPNEDQT